MAKTSHNSGELKFTHNGPLEFGYGNMKKAIHCLPMWISGKNPAQITANMVIASAALLTPVRHFCLKINKIAEIKVPA